MKERERKASLGIKGEAFTECEPTKCACRLDERSSRYVKGKRTDRRWQKTPDFVDKAVQSLSQHREPLRGRLPTEFGRVWVVVVVGGRLDGGVTTAITGNKGLPVWIQ